MIANILTPLDGSPLAERALPYAAALAGAAKAHLRLLHVMPIIPAVTRPWAEVDVAARLEHLAHNLRAKDIQATARTITGHPAAVAILEAAADPPADLIIMSTHGRSGIGRWLYGSVADRVLQQSEVPVLLVPPTLAHTWPTDRRPKIIVPLDGSDPSEAALGPARELAETLGADVLMMRVVEGRGTAVYQFDPVGLAVRQATTEEIQTARTYLDGIAASSDPAVPPADVLIEEGDPFSAIARIARQETADLIIMATHGRTGLARLTMGSVATTTLQRAHVPVLMIRPPGLVQETAEPTQQEDAVPEAWPPVGTAGAAGAR